MHSLSLLLVCLLATAGCKGDSKDDSAAKAPTTATAPAPAAPAAPAPVPAPAAPTDAAATAADPLPVPGPGGWLGAVSRDHADKDIAIVCDDAGMAAWVEGTRLPIHDTKASWCLADPLSDVIWLATGSAVSVLDLKSDQPQPEVVVEGWPADETGTPKPVSITHSNAKQRYGNDSHNDDFNIAIDVAGAKTTIEKGNFSFNVEEEEYKKIGNTLKIVNAPLLKRLTERAAAKTMPKDPTSSCPKLVKGLPEECDSGDCGSTEAIPNSDYCRVLVSQSCGDGCYSSYAFYDAKKKAFMYGYKPGGESAGAPFGTSSALRVSPSGRHIIADGAVSDWEKKIVSSGAAGWLGFAGKLYGE